MFSLIFKAWELFSLSLLRSVYNWKRRIIWLLPEWAAVSRMAELHCSASAVLSQWFEVSAPAVCVWSCAPGWEAGWWWMVVKSGSHVRDNALRLQLAKNRFASPPLLLSSSIVSKNTSIGLSDMVHAESSIFSSSDKMSSDRASTKV